MKLSRKEFLRLSLAGGVGLFLPFGASGCGGLFSGNNSSEGSAGALLKSAAKLPEPFTIPLPIPPVLEPVHTDASADHYEITQKVGRAEILPGLKTEVWGRHVRRNPLLSRLGSTRWCRSGRVCCSTCR